MPKSTFDTFIEMVEEYGPQEKQDIQEYPEPGEYEWEGDIKLNGKKYYIFADFDYETDAGAHEVGIDGREREHYVELPFTVLKSKVYELTDTGPTIVVTDQTIIDAAEDAALALARNDERYIRSKGWSNWE